MDSFNLSIAVLAAGRSERFGSADKLEAKFQNKMLGHHVTQIVAQIPATSFCVISSAAEHPCAPGWRAAGFEVVANPNSAAGIGTSIALAGELALSRKAGALLICLADMPLVPLSHYLSIAKHAVALNENGIVASSNGSITLPPVCFREGHLAELANLQGDAGARHLLSSAITLDCPPELLVDIDDRATLARLS